MDHDSKVSEAAEGRRWKENEDDNEIRAQHEEGVWMPELVETHSAEWTPVLEPTPEGDVETESSFQTAQSGADRDRAE